MLFKGGTALFLRNILFSGLHFSHNVLYFMQIYFQEAQFEL